MTYETQVAGARARGYAFIPAQVRVDVFPPDALAPADFYGFEGDVAIIREKSYAVLVEPLDRVFTHELAHAGHGAIRRAQGFPQWRDVETAVKSQALVSDPTLQAFWRAMGYTTPLDVAASTPWIHDSDPTEHFAEACAHIVIGLRPAESGLASFFSRYGGDLDAHRAELDAFFRGLAKETPKMANIPDPAGFLLSHPITQLFGVPEGVAPSGFHTGIDFGMSEGVPVPAVHAGRVRFAADAATVGERLSGILVIVTTDDGDEWWHAHLSGVACLVGDRVKAGDVIGFVGSTGAATGPHLHLEWRHPQNTAIDPMEEVTMLSQQAQDAIRGIVKDEVSRAGASIEAKLDSGFNTSMPVMLRRLGRWMRLGVARDPAGDPRTTPPSPYSDDFVPFS